jgi:predicted PurR-regulated permease PerM
MGSVLGGMCLGAYSLRGQVQTIIDQVPKASTRFAEGISRKHLSQAGNLQTIQDAATKVEKATTEAAAVVFLVFFLLLGGDTFRRKLVRIAGPSLSRMKIAVHILDGINASIQKYMLMLLTTNLLVGLLSWIAFRLFWGWLWGVWGMLLSIPLIVIVKVVSQHVEQLHPLAELLGD